MLLVSPTLVKIVVYSSLGRGVFSFDARLANACPKQLLLPHAGCWLSNTLADGIGGYV